MDPVNLMSLKENLDFDEELIREIINIYFNLYPSQIKNLREAMEKLDYDNVKGYAHDIKGTVLNFGAERAFELAYSIEEAGKSKDIKESTKKAFIELQNELKEIELFFRRAKI